MNSRSERGGYRIARLTVTPTEWEAKKQLETLDDNIKGSNNEILRLKERIKASKC